MAATIGSSVAGYPLGLAYARRAAYGVTAGDVGVLTTAVGVGTLGAATFLAKGEPGGRRVAGTLTAGMVAGALLGDRLFVEPHDFTESEGWLMRLGAVAGGLIGIALPAASGSNDARAYLGMGTLGALLGMVATLPIIDPKGAATARTARCLRR